MPKPGFNPQLGVPPVLQWAAPSQLAIDMSYQRSIDNTASQRLIKDIAANWNWGLCLPLVVNRRAGGGVSGELFVIDGQHRLAAARLRKDIPHLPCVILGLPDTTDEAAKFVKLNQRRRPLTNLNLFKAALASGETEAREIAAALGDAGLAIAQSSNPNSWKPGQLVNVGGLKAAYRRHGAANLRAALHVFAGGFGGQLLRYAGTIWPGVTPLVATLTARCDPLDWMDGEQAITFAEMLESTPQEEWRETILTEIVANPSLTVPTAAEKVIAEAWAELQAALNGEDESDSEAQAFDRARRGALGELASAEP
ncbi:DUF6551 family protein [Sphingopyxis sp.]|jgi:hypothetical protein|uniref:DUF6551 family protein n=1 Tax=Sphingopyxis sp. TaxID=1908224 RepID=UPI003F6F1A5E